MMSKTAFPPYRMRGDSTPPGELRTISIAEGNVMQFEEAKDWRQLLGMIIQDTRIRQRIIGELGIKAITLHRWVNGGIDPRPQHFKQLLNTLPDYREQFIDLLGGDYDESLASTSAYASTLIPPPLFATLLRNLSKI